MRSIVEDVEDLYKHIAASIPLHELKDTKYKEQLDTITSRFPFSAVISPLSLMTPFYISPKALAFAGLNAPDVQHLNISFFARILHPDNLHILQQCIKHFTYTPNDYFINTYHVKSTDGNWHWVYGCSKTITKDSKDQSANYILTIFYNVEFLLQQSKTETPDKNNADLNQHYLQVLTTREKEIFDFIIKGADNHKISKALHISESTVQTHKKNLMKKLGIKTTADLVRLAINYGTLKSLAMIFSIQQLIEMRPEMFL